MQSNSNLAGTLFAIKRYAIHDGPDVRVTLFFKGCPLSCHWCHNPEGVGKAPFMHSNTGRCVDCGDCLRACPQHALSFDGTERKRNTNRCKTCGECARVCPSLTHEVVGSVWTVADVVREIEKEAPFFEGTQGGVTFSGGEPLAQPRFLAALLEACAERGWHRAIDTSGFTLPEVLARIEPLTDLFLLDIKHMDTRRHQAFTGVPNERILENARWLARRGAGLRLRLPLVPGTNDDMENIVRTGHFAVFLGMEEIDLLPYHDTGKNKYKKLGLPYPAQHITPPDPEAINRAVRLLNDCGLAVRIGG